MTVVVLGYAALAVWLYHPLFSDPARAVFGPALAAVDVKLSIWVMAWDWHALTTAPLSLFNANIFHPFPLSLAGSEHMLGHLPIFGPVYAVSGNPVLAFQLNALLNLALCGAAMYALLRHWQVPVAAALFGGFVYAYCPIRGVGHAHLIAGQYLPLALLFFDRTLTEARGRPAAAFSVCLMLQMLTSYYLAYITVIAVAGYAAGVLWATRGRLPPRGLVLIVVAALAAGGVVAGLSLPYVQLRSLGVVPDHSSDTGQRIVDGATDLWRNYVLPPIAVRVWGVRLRQGLSVYVGLLPLACVAAAFLPRRGQPVQGARRWARSGAVGLSIACYVMAVGPELQVGEQGLPLPYALAMRLVPGFSSMRVPSRFGLGLMAGAAALAGLGLARLLDLIGASGRRRAAAAVALIALGLGTAAEYDLLRPHFRVHRLRVGSELPPVYRALAKLPPGPVLEIPAGIPGSMEETDYMLYGTYHWQRLLNGYSAYQPPTYFAVLALARLLPDERATDLLARLTGLRYVVVHLSKLPVAERLAWQAPAGLRLIESFAGDRLFAVADPPPADLLPRFIDFTSRDETVLGTSLAPLPEPARRAELLLQSRPPVALVPGIPLRLDLEVTNRSAVTWPALAAAGDHVVAVAYRWESADGTVLHEFARAARLPYDLAPGESVRVPVYVIGFGPPGRRRLTLGLAQDGIWFPDPLGPFPISIALAAAG